MAFKYDSLNGHITFLAIDDEFDLHAIYLLYNKINLILKYWSY
jgi:hypothetical protein